MDIADRAQEIEERERCDSLARQARASVESPLLDAAGQHLCMDCQEPIDLDRRMAAPHAVRCLQCQCDHERLLKMHIATRPVC